MKPTPAQSGFTLLELVLAMAMISMLTLSLYSSLSIAFKARDSAAASIGPMRAVNVAMELIRHDLEAALPPTGILAGAMIGGPQPDGIADADSVEFYSVGSSAERPGDPTAEGVRKVEIGVEISPLDDARVLVRRVTTNLLAPVALEPEPEIICRGVRSFTLRYFDGATWLEDWDSTAYGDVLPTAVEVNLELDWPVPAPGEAPRQTPAYRVSRVYTLPCHKEAEEAAEGEAS